MRTVATPASRLALLAALVAWTAIALLPPRRPAPLPATAPAEQFSAGRAMVHVSLIAQRPHPTGSVENGRARDYIRAQLAQMGVQSELQSGVSESRRTSGAKPRSGYVENIVCRLAGTATTKAVLLVAHYDSVSNSPGAADDASGVAVLLETARVLRGLPPLRNDVIFLFTDSEERLQLGATFFAAKDPWARDPGVVLNFDGGANGGVVYLVGTTAGNEWLARELRAVAPNVIGASATSRSVLHSLGMFYDLDPLEDAGLAGMTFGFFNNANFRHRPEDDITRLDRASVQQFGDYGLAATRRFGNVDLRQRHSGDAVFFPIPMIGLVVYPIGWAAPLAWLVTLMVAIATWTGWRRRARGVWIAIPLGILAVTQLVVATTMPAASYLLTWPLMAAVISFAVLMTVSRSISFGARLGVMLACPAAPLLLLAPLVRTAVSVIPTRAYSVWIPLVTGLCSLILFTALPQLTLMLRRPTGASRTPDIAETRHASGV
jgi:Peptidase family M28